MAGYGEIALVRSLGFLAEKQASLLAEQNAALDARVKELHTDAEIERLAREQYNLVKPGEEAYAKPIH